MSSESETSKSWEGAMEIIRFNWPMYAVAVAVCGACLWRRDRLSLVVLAVTAYWSIGSVAVSHWIYDLSPLGHWDWLVDWIGYAEGPWAMIQAGFDSSHGALRRAFPRPPEAVVDLYGAPGVGGASIRRARAENPPDAPALQSLPAANAAYEIVVAIFALHEIRSPAGREAMFASIRDSLAPGGRLVVVEHARDWRNFLAFGPGFLHFQPKGEWRRCAGAAGLRFERERSITPFVRALLWSKA